MSNAPPDPSLTAMAAEELARLNAALQAELVAIKAETSAKVTTLEDTIANLAHENALLKRRLYGNKTERSHTAEVVVCQVSIGAERVETGRPENSWTDRGPAGSIGIRGFDRSDPGLGGASRIVAEAARRRRRVSLVPPIRRRCSQHRVAGHAVAR